MNVQAIHGCAVAVGYRAAAREAPTPGTTAVARICGQAVAVAHMAGHSRQVPAYTAKALADDTARRDAKLAWQQNQLPNGFERYVHEES